MEDKTIGEWGKIAADVYLKLVRLKEEMAREEIYFEMPKFIEVNSIYFHFEKDKLIAIRPKYYQGPIAIDATVKNDKQS